MRSKHDIRVMLEELLLERGVRVTQAEKLEEFVGELDELIEDLITVRFTVVRWNGTCGNPNCPVHGTHPAGPVNDPLSN